MKQLSSLSSHLIAHFERLLQENDSTPPTIIPIANVTQKQDLKVQQFQKSFQGHNFNYRKSCDGYNGNTSHPWQSLNCNHPYQADSFCNFCENTCHDTHDCINLVNFLKDKNMSVVYSTSKNEFQSLIENATTSSPMQEP